MLINFNKDKPIHVVGTGVPAHEISHWIKQEYSSAEVKNVSIEDYKILPPQSQCVMGFANIEYRKNLISDPTWLKHHWLTFIHPTCIVENFDHIGPGSVIEPMTIVMYETSLGNFSWLAPYVLIGHGTKLGNNVVVGPGVVIGGSTIIGDNVLIGQKSSIKDRIIVGNEIEFLMNSVVTKDTPESGRYYGNKRIP